MAKERINRNHRIVPANPEIVYEPFNSPVPSPACPIPPAPLPVPSEADLLRAQIKATFAKAPAEMEAARKRGEAERDAYHLKRAALAKAAQDERDEKAAINARRKDAGLLPK